MVTPALPQESSLTRADIALLLSWISSTNQVVDSDGNIVGRLYFEDIELQRPFPSSWTAPVGDPTEITNKPAVIGDLDQNFVVDVTQNDIFAQDDMLAILDSRDSLWKLVPADTVAQGFSQILGRGGVTIFFNEETRQLRIDSSTLSRRITALERS